MYSVFSLTVNIGLSLPIDAFPRFLAMIFLKPWLFLRYWEITAKKPCVEIIVLTLNITTEVAKRYFHDITKKSYSSFKNFAICHLKVPVHKDI